MQYERQLPLDARSPQSTEGQNRQPSETRLRNAVIFGKENYSQFLDAARKYPNYSFAVVEAKNSGKLPREVEELGAICLVLVMQRGVFRFLSDADYYLATGLRHPVILIPSGNHFGQGLAPLLSGAVIDAIILIARGWEQLAPFLEKQRLSVYFRGKGNGINPEGDAWCRVINTIEKSNLGGYGGAKISKAGQLNELSIAKTFLRQMQRIYLSDDEAVGSSQAIVLIDPSYSVVSGERNYEESVQSLLVRNGWDFHKGGGDPWRDNYGGPFDWISSKEKATFDIDINRHIDRAISNGNNIREHIKITRLFVAEKGGDVGSFDNDGLSLYVTVRDLLNFHASHPSIWMLLAQQIRRIENSSNNTDKTRYLAIILNIAMKNEVLDHSISYLANTIKYNFEERYTIKCNRLTYREHDLDCNVKLIDTKYERPMTKLLLRVTKDGPKLLSKRIDV